MGEEIIKVENLTKVYDKDTRVLENLKMSIKKGEWTTIMRPSGSGKTTFLNSIGCLDSATRGSVFIKNTEITKLNQTKLTKFRRENIGLIFQ